MGYVAAATSDAKDQRVDFGRRGFFVASL